MKAHLLFRGGYASAEVLKRKEPKIHKALFKGIDGHDLQKLADHLRLKNVMALAGKSWADDEVWKRMAASERPYTLRYGAESVETSKVEEELKRASEILSILLSGIRGLRLDGAQRRSGSGG